MAWLSPGGPLAHSPPRDPLVLPLKCLCFTSPTIVLEIKCNVPGGETELFLYKPSHRPPPNPRKVKDEKGQPTVYKVPRLPVRCCLSLLAWLTSGETSRQGFAHSLPHEGCLCAPGLPKLPEVSSAHTHGDGLHPHLPSGGRLPQGRRSQPP